MQSARGRLVPYDAYLKGGPKIAGSSSPVGCQWLFSLLLIVISILTTHAREPRRGHWLWPTPPKGTLKHISSSVKTTSFSPAKLISAAFDTSWVKDCCDWQPCPNNTWYKRHQAVKLSKRRLRSGRCPLVSVFGFTRPCLGRIGKKQREA